jgi:hypothetical protein
VTPTFLKITHQAIDSSTPFQSPMNLSKNFSSLITEFRQNTRLRVGIWLITTLLMSYAASFLQDYQAQLKKDYQETISRLNQLQSLVTQTQWLERATQSQALLNQLQVKFWQANTEGLAQAKFQKWLTEQLDRAQIEKPNVRMESTLPVPKYPKVWKVAAQVNATFNPAKLNILLLAIAEHLFWTTVEQLEVRYTQFTIIVTAYFQVSQ